MHRYLYGNINWDAKLIGIKRARGVEKTTMTFDRTRDIADGFLAVDGTERGHANRIPLWLFGMLY